MAKLTRKRVEEILAAHKEWLDSGYVRGARADLAAQDLRKFSELISGANLRGAYLSGANLSGAYLRGANLRDAYLRGANLRDAYLRDADLSGANLRDANLRGANLRDAYLRDAYLRGANLSDANLRDANLRDAYLRGANLRDGDLRELLAVPDLDQKILAAIEGGGKLNMHTWHTCETTHCRAGWAVVIAGEKGRVLEALQGTCAAASLIYACSRPDKPIPDFFATNEAAMASIKADAGVVPA